MLCGENDRILRESIERIFDIRQKTWKDHHCFAFGYKESLADSKRKEMRRRRIRSLLSVLVTLSVASGNAAQKLNHDNNRRIFLRARGGGMGAGGPSSPSSSLGTRRAPATFPPPQDTYKSSSPLFSEERAREQEKLLAKEAMESFLTRDSRNTFIGMIHLPEKRSMCCRIQ